MTASIHYLHTRRAAMHAVERHAHHRAATITALPVAARTTAPRAMPPAVDRFAEIPRVLGRYWLLWLLAYAAISTASFGLFVASFLQGSAAP